MWCVMFLLLADFFFSSYGVQFKQLILRMMVASNNIIMCAICITDKSLIFVGISVSWIGW